MKLMSSINRIAIHHNPTNPLVKLNNTTLTTNDPNTPLQPLNGFHIIRILRPGLTDSSNIIKIWRKCLLIRK